MAEPSIAGAEETIDVRGVWSRERVASDDEVSPFTPPCLEEVEDLGVWDEVPLTMEDESVTPLGNGYDSGWLS